MTAIGDLLVLRHASKRPSGTWSDDDYDVMSGDRAVGRIFRPGAGAPPDRPWMWTITQAVVVPAMASHGFAATIDEAKSAFADHWRKRQSIVHERG